MEWESVDLVGQRGGSGFHSAPARVWVLGGICVLGWPGHSPTMGPERPGHLPRPLLHPCPLPPLCSSFSGLDCIVER